MEDMDEIVGEFLVESYENLDRLDRELVSLEQNPSDRAILASIFRTIHTIKGSCAFLGFKKLEGVTHVGENLLSKLRDGLLPLTPERTTVLLKLVDAVRALLGNIEATHAEGADDYGILKVELAALTEGESAAGGARAPEGGAGHAAPSAPAVPAPGRPAPQAPPAQPVYQAPPAQPVYQAPPQVVQAPPAQPPPAPAPQAPQAQPAVHPAQPQGAAPGKPDLAFDADDGKGADKFGELLISQGKVNLEQVARARAIQQAGDPRRMGEILVAIGALKPQDVVDTLSKQTETRPSIADNSIRVDVNLLERLMNLVGELVLARNQILQVAEHQEDASFLAASQRLNLITTELQEGVMKTRMQPIGTLWSKFPRLIRDLALHCGKQVRIEMDGKDTELDRTIIEALKDPLTHLVRNSVDHGIELPEMRTLLGKPAEGRLYLRAFHEGGQVNIEITDDGGGIDPEKIKAKAISKGLHTSDQVNRMSEREILNLIFLPGFSTAEKITNISGRGVGMDVVRTNIEKIGGSLDLSSAVGKGTTLKIKIPLTLAIIPALIVSTMRERYAIPQVSLLELVRLEGAQAQRGIEEVLGAPVYRLRGKLLPLLFLKKELHLKVRDEDGSGERDTINIVVLQADERQFGLVVDEINDTQEIVVKPLGKLIKGQAMFAGATIMGDGRVALILDVLGMAQRARMVQQQAARAGMDVRARDDKGEQKQSLLLFEVGEHGRMGIPLSSVARLEEFPTKSIEFAGGQAMVQYRGQIMRLIYLNNFLVERRKEARALSQAAVKDTDRTAVVVYSRNGRSLGLVVGKIMDVVEELITEQKPGSRKGVLATAIVHNRVTQLLDVEGIIRSVDPKFLEAA